MCAPLASLWGNSSCGKDVDSLFWTEGYSLLNSCSSWHADTNWDYITVALQILQYQATKPVHNVLLGNFCFTVLVFSYVPIEVRYQYLSSGSHWTCKPLHTDGKSVNCWLDFLGKDKMGFVCMTACVWEDNISSILDAYPYNLSK